MEGMGTARCVGNLAAVAAVLGCLSLAQAADARHGQPAVLRGSGVPIVVISAPPLELEPGRGELAQRPEDRSTASNGATRDLDIGADSPTAVWALFADVPLAAWFLLVTCLLGAGLGPYALRSLQDDTQDAAPAEPHRAPKSHRTGLT
jgi:hypothetical protein